MEKVDVKIKATRAIKKYGQEVIVYIFDKVGTFGIPKTEKKLDQDDVDTEEYDDVDIFSPITDPSNVTIADDTPTDDIEKKYKTGVKIFCLFSTATTPEIIGDAGAQKSNVTGDLFTLSDQLEKSGLPMGREDWADSYIEYTEFGITIKKKVSNVAFSSRWGNESLTFEIFFEKDAA